MNKTYISDVIPNYEYQHWQRGDKILINAPTGSGKSYFTINILSRHAQTTNDKVLILTNRKILKEQVESDAKRYPNVKVYNYQELTIILKNGTFNIDRYKYVVADECHFFFSDSYFNSETDITLEYLTNLKNNIAIFLSATCEVFKEYIADQNIKYYGLENELYYDNLYYFEKPNTVIKLLESLPENEKVIYFCSNVSNAYTLHKQFESNSAFLCSDNNNKYSEFSNQEVRNNIINEAKFDQQILFTTKILDNGVNIKDNQLKHIIIDIYDFDTIQQCVGRKRFINDNDKLNIYIKKFKQSSIQSYYNQWSRILKFGNEFKKLNQQEYLSKYGRKNTNGLVYNQLQTDGTIKLKMNEAYYYKLNNDIQLANKVRALNKTLPNKLGHLQILCDRYKIQLSEFSCLDDSITTNSFNEQLLKYINIKMFKNEQKEFKEFIKSNAVKTVAKNHGALGINTINGYFEDNGILYRLQSERETSGDDKGKRYWKLYKLV